MASQPPGQPTPQNPSPFPRPFNPGLNAPPQGNPSFPGPPPTATAFGRGGPSFPMPGRGPSGPPPGLAGPPTRPPPSLSGPPSSLAGPPTGPPPGLSGPPTRPPPGLAGARPGPFPRPTGPPPSSLGPAPSAAAPSAPPPFARPAFPPGPAFPAGPPSGPAAVGTSHPGTYLGQPQPQPPPSTTAAAAASSGTVARGGTASTALPNGPPVGPFFRPATGGGGGGGGPPGAPPPTSAAAATPGTFQSQSYSQLQPQQPTPFPTTAPPNATPNAPPPSFRPPFPSPAPQQAAAFARPSMPPPSAAPFMPQPPSFGGQPPAYASQPPPSLGAPPTSLPGQGGMGQYGRGPGSISAAAAPPPPPLAGPPTTHQALQHQQQQHQPQQQPQELIDNFQSLTLASAPGLPSPVVNPDELPRPAEDPEGAGLDAPAGVPPLEGSAPPRFFRLTTNAVPESQSLRSRWHLPLGAVVTPLAPCPEGEEVPVVNFGPSGIVRCRRCRTYINPFVAFTDAGRRWRCNVCGLLNEVTQDYYCSLDSSGRRLDASERPELSLGSVEFVAPVEYMVRPPMPPTFFFLIDVSQPGGQAGQLQVIADTIRACLDNLPGDSRTRISFLLFDSSLHFISLKSSLSQPQLLVMSDVDDPFLPLPADELLVNLSESRQVVEALLDALPSMFAKGSSPESATGPALKAMFLLMAQLGGKVLLFQSTLPSLGVGALRIRGEDPRLYGSDREHSLRTADDPFFKTFAADCSRVHISIDVFSFAAKYSDIATLGTLARYTGGQVYSYPSFQLAVDGDRFSRELGRNLTRETGWEAVMRIRCGKGLKIGTFHGHFFIRSSDLLALPSVDCDKSYAVQISHEDALLTNQSAAFFQCALLYTSSSGERRIRVHTVAAPICRDLTAMYKSADASAAVAVLSKIALEKSLNSKLDDTRRMVQEKCILALKEYRNLFGMSLHAQLPYPSHPHQSPSPSSSQRLIFPPSLRLLPLFALGLCKSPPLRGGFQEMGADARSAAGYDMMCSSVTRTLRMIYPLLIRLDDMAAHCGKLDENGKVQLPPALPLVTTSLDSQGAFLIDNGLLIMLWLGGALPAATAAAIVGPEALAAPDISLAPYIPAQGDFSQRVSAIVDHLRGSPAHFKKVQILRQGGSREIAFYHNFVEDRSDLGPSYSDFLVQIFRQAQSR